jgi:hypothetical protein
MLPCVCTPHPPLLPPPPHPCPHRPSPTPPGAPTPLPTPHPRWSCAAAGAGRRSPPHKPSSCAAAPPPSAAAGRHRRPRHRIGPPQKPPACGPSPGPGWHCRTEAARGSCGSSGGVAAGRQAGSVGWPAWRMRGDRRGAAGEDSPHRMGAAKTGCQRTSGAWDRCHRILKPFCPLGGAVPRQTGRPPTLLALSSPCQRCQQVLVVVSGDRTGWKRVNRHPGKLVAGR